jgi:hypothetical protein
LYQSIKTILANVKNIHPIQDELLGDKHNVVDKVNFEHNEYELFGSNKKNYLPLTLRNVVINYGFSVDIPNRKMFKRGLRTSN